MKTINKTLYNNCKDMSEPNWDDYDALEIMACYEDEDSTTPITEVSDAHLAEFYTVYGHLKEGGVEALTDVSTLKMAEDIAHIFSMKLNGCPIYNYAAF